MAIIKPNNNTISAITALPSGMTSAPGLTTGKVLQVVNSSNSYQKSTSSGSPSDMESSSGTVWETAITPSATSSKILALANISWYAEMSGTASDVRAYIRMHKKIGSGSYSAVMNTPYTGMYFYSAQRYDLSNWQQIFTNLSSPSTTDAVTYKFDSYSLSTTNWNLVHNYACTSTLTLMEVAG